MFFLQRLRSKHGEIYANIPIHSALWTLSLTHTGENIDSVLKKIFGLLSEQGTGGIAHWESSWTLLVAKYYSSVKSEGLRLAGHKVRKRKTNIQGALVVETWRKESLERPRQKWNINIKIDLTYSWWKCVEFIDVAQERDKWRCLVNTEMNLRVV